jgi:molecular chaperone IbpA
MRDFDLSPLFRSSVGFDRLDKLFEAAFRDASRDVSYPPYNIARTGENAYRITMAVAGFGEGDLDISVHENVLSIRGQIRDQEKDVAYLHRGIAQRAFEHRFQLADHVKVVDASLERGLLNLRLERVVPETLKPRKITIATPNAAKPRVIEGGSDAAAA